MNIKLNIAKSEVTKLDINDEYDRAAICHILEEHQQAMPKANTPGCGKSYICEGMVELGHKVIVRCPTNTLSQNHEAANDTITSVTPLVGIKLGDMNITSCDCYEFDVFVFDELDCNDTHVLTRFKSLLILITIE